MNIWQELKQKIQPFTALAPMEDVTDTVFRQVILKTGRPDVFFTEFMSVDGLFSKGNKIVSRKLNYFKKEKPIVAQVWGLKPENYLKVGKLLKEYDFDGIDINMGCPVRKIVKTGGCAALIKNRSLAKEIILATQEGCHDLPVSVKTRIGYDKIETEDWIAFLLAFKLDALTVHGRIAIEMSKKQANWPEVKKAVELKNKISPNTIIIGNGDVREYSQFADFYKQFGVDGVMVGRGIFSNPWLFSEKKSNKQHTTLEYLDIFKSHIKLYKKIWQDKKNPEILKKFMKMYVRDFDGAGEMREKIANSKGYEELLSILEAVN